MNATSSGGPRWIGPGRKGSVSASLGLGFGLFTLLSVAGCRDGAVGEAPIDAGLSGNAGISGATAGIGGAGGTAGVDTTTVVPDLGGRWRMLGFEDPVAVDLVQMGTALGGWGCCSGLDPLPSLDCCGTVTGQCAGRRVSFGFTFVLGGEYKYVTDAFASADGRRMAGTFSRTDSPVAWVRVDPEQPDPAQGTPTIETLLEKRVASYALLLSDSAPPGTDFAPQRPYRLYINYHEVGGELGAFGASEISWRAADQALTAGPVPETAPGLPTLLELRFSDVVLTDVEATLASGTTYHFRATPTTL